MQQINKFEELFNVDLDEAAKLLQKAINYGDYLAEQKRLADIAVVDRKTAMRESLLVAKNDAAVCTGKDASTRESQAEAYAAREVRDYSIAKIESEYVTDLFKNNHDRIEALRSIMSAKKTNGNDYRSNPIM